MATANSSIADPALEEIANQEIERGLQLDFYSPAILQQPMVLSAWASFFRNQYVALKEQLARSDFDRKAELYRRVTNVLEKVETKIVKSPQMEQVFRNDPFGSSMVSSTRG